MTVRLQPFYDRLATASPHARTMVRLVSPIALAAALAFAVPACGAGSDAATSPALETSTTPPSSSPAPSTTAPATTLHVTWEQHAPPITIATPFCDAAGACLFPYRQDAIATGDVEGKATSAGDAAAPPSGKPNTYASIMTSVFTGRFASCGSGTAIIRRVESVDPETGAWSGHWQLVRGFGTGGLTALTGSGDIELPTPTSSADLPSRFVGDVSCNGDRDATAPVAARDGDASTITFHSGDRHTRTGPDRLRCRQLVRLANNPEGEHDGRPPRYLRTGGGWPPVDGSGCPRIRRDPHSTSFAARSRVAVKAHWSFGRPRCSRGRCSRSSGRSSRVTAAVR